MMVAAVIITCGPINAAQEGAMYLRIRDVVCSGVSTMQAKLHSQNRISNKQFVALTAAVITVYGFYKKYQQYQRLQELRKNRLQERERGKQAYEQQQRRKKFLAEQPLYAQEERSILSRNARLAKMTAQLNEPQQPSIEDTLNKQLDRQSAKGVRAPRNLARETKISAVDAAKVQQAIEKEKQRLQDRKKQNFKVD